MTEITPPSPEEPLGENQDVQATPPPPPPPPTAPVYGEGAPAAAAHVPGPGPAQLMDRFIAKLIDGVIMFAATMIVVVFIIAGAIFSSGNTSFIVGVISSVITTLIYLGYLSYMEHSQGRTVGKMVMKLRVVGPNGGNPTLEEAVKRNIWAGLSILGIIPIIGGVIAGIGQLIAVIMIAVGINNDPANRQAWHDQFAGGTRVIKEG